MTTLRVLNEPAAIESLRPAWKQLVGNCEAATVYQTPEWALGWWRALGRNSTPFCVALDEGERLVGLAPLAIEPRRGTRTLRFMGAPHDGANCATVERGYERIFADAFATALARHAGIWDVAQLAEPLGHEIQLAQACARRAPELGVHALGLSCTPVVNFQADWADYWKRVSAQQRKMFRKKWRRLERRGTISFQVLTAPETMAEELERLFQARLQNWRERRRLNKMVAFQRTRAYYDTLSGICMELARSGQVWLARLDVDGHSVGWKLAFRVNQTLAGYMTTFDAQFSEYSPGLLTFIELARFAVTHGIKRFDLGCGTQPYKFRFGAEPYNTSTSVLFWKRPQSLLFLGQEIARNGVLTIRRLRQDHLLHG